MQSHRVTGEDNVWQRLPEHYNNNNNNNNTNGPFFSGKLHSFRLTVVIGT